MNDKTPNIRFKGFTDDWEQRKLGELGEILTGSTPSTSNSAYYSEDGIPWVTPTDINELTISDTPRKLSEEGAKVGRIVPANTILCTCIASIGKNTLLTVKGSFNQQINSLTPNAWNDAYFLLTESELWANKMKQMAASGIMQIVNKTEFSNLDTLVPSTDEQKKIGSYFRNLDKLITLHQRKSEQLLNIKKSMLEKMFPKNGKKVPEIRFDGFTDDWEQRKLGDDLVSIHTGTNLLGSTTNTGMPLIKMGNIQRGYFDTSKVEFLAENEQPDNEDIANYGDFFFNTRNTLELVGKGATWMKNSGEYAFNSNIARFELRNIDTIFFNYLYNTETMTRQIHARAMGTTSVAAIYPKTLESVGYLVPCMKEQQKIGAYFKHLDHLITLHQRKLGKLQNIKKSILEQMFI